MTTKFKCVSCKRLFAYVFLSTLRGPRGGVFCITCSYDVDLVPDCFDLTGTEDSYTEESWP